MGAVLQIKRGRKKDLPLLEQGELGFCLDTKELFIGAGEENILLCVGSEVEEE